MSGRLYGLPVWTQRALSSHKEPQELWRFAAKIRDRVPKASQWSPSRTAHLGCGMIAAGSARALGEALAAHGVEADHVKVWQTVGKLRRRHGLVMSGEPREPGYRVRDWTWEAKRVRSSVGR